MKLSIILPTYNNEKTIEDCLKSVFSQKFLRKDFEVLFIDGGSTDKTLQIAKKYPVKIIKNIKRNEEAARILGINRARGEILCFIDADNILVGTDWISKMLLPFENKNIAFDDTLYYSYRKNDKIRVKYQVLIGGDDPIAMYLGLYSRWCYLYNNWTNYPHKDVDKGDYIETKMLNTQLVPPMGSNGFLVRKNILKKFVKNSFIHSDVVYFMIKKGYNCFAKVKTGIIHNQPRFFPNKARRIKRRLNNEVKIQYDYGVTKKDTLKTLVYMCLILPVLWDTLRGFYKKPSIAWIFHPVACFGELFLHGYYTIKHKIIGRA